MRHHFHVLIVVLCNLCLSKAMAKGVTINLPEATPIVYPDQSCVTIPSSKNLQKISDLNKQLYETAMCQKLSGKIEGTASHYGKNDNTDGNTAYCGEVFKANVLTVALPQGDVVRKGNQLKPGQVYCGTVVRVTNKRNGKYAFARVIDTGSFGHKYNRVIDVSLGTSKLLGFEHQGLTSIKIEFCEK